MPDESTSSDTGFDPSEAQDRLDQLGQDIAETRRTVTADVEPAASDDDDDGRYVDSGATPDEDDQNAAPA